MCTNDRVVLLVFKVKFHNKEFRRSLRTRELNTSLSEALIWPMRRENSETVQDGIYISIIH